MCPAISNEPLYERRLRWQKVSKNLDSSAMRVTLLASYTITPLVPYLGLAMYDAGTPACITVGPFGQIVQSLMDRDSEIERFAPEAVAVAPRIEDMVRAGAVTSAGELASQLREISYAALRAADRWNAQLAVICPVVEDLSGHEIVGSGDCIAALVDAVNGRPGVEVVRYDDIIDTIGRTRSYHPALFSHAKIPYREAVFARLAERVAPVLSGTDIRPAPGFFLLEMDSILSACGHTRSMAMTALLRALSSLRQSGWRLGMIADLRSGAAGRESAELLKEIDDLADCWLAPSVSRIGSSYLTSYIGHPAGELYLLTVEGSRTYEYNVRDTYSLTVDENGWPSVAAQMLDDLLPGAGLPTMSVYDYDDGPVSLKQYLSSLELQVSCDPACGDDVAPLVIFAERFVEFGLGVSPTPTELAAAVVAQNHTVWSISVRDRTGDYGCSGLVHFSFSNDICVVHSFSLSCTVLGRGVEDVILDKIKNQARAWKCNRIVARLLPTARNESAVMFWTKSARGASRDGAPSLSVNIQELPHLQPAGLTSCRSLSSNALAPGYACGHRCCTRRA